ncbi:MULTISPECIES: YjcQ family protein [Morganellaceae]|uniref:YjcQ family protein n=1 Tax=Moellerella wisconsensis TaxID=158849 RepID=A0ACD3YC26_9GAMM|nr:MULTISPECIES: YjcQ family protein [Morganellaceae]UNH39989.1 YjcQ family protein [Moellerella wisconsensis]
MIDKFDRSLQRELLKLLYDLAPNTPEQQALNDFAEKFGSMDYLVANLQYLKGHGLIDTDFQSYIGGHVEVNTHKTKITSKGIDFLREDGGLSSVLNIQIIKIHSDTLSQLESFIIGSNMPEAEKMGLIAKLRELPASAIIHLTNELTVKAVLALPSALPLIQKYLAEMFR